MAASPTQRTLTRLRQLGYVVAVVEKWNPHVKVRQDLFGCIDVIAVKPGTEGVLGVQATTATNVNARLKKARSLTAIEAWLLAKNPFQVWGWYEKAGRWEPVVVALQAGEMQPTVLNYKRRKARVLPQGELW